MDAEQCGGMHYTMSRFSAISFGMLAANSWLNIDHALPFLFPMSNRYSFMHLSHLGRVVGMNVLVWVGLR